MDWTNELRGGLDLCRPRLILFAVYLSVEIRNVSGSCMCNQICLYNVITIIPHSCASLSKLSLSLNLNAHLSRIRSMRTPREAH